MLFTTLWAVLQMILLAGTRLAGLAVGAVFHTTEAGIPPAFLTWNDGRQFTLEVHFTRIK